MRPGALTAPRPAARAGTRSVGGGSFDAVAGSINPMFRFFAPRLKPVILNPTTGAGGQAVTADRQAARPAAGR